MGNNCKSSGTVSYGFEYDVKNCTANIGNYLLQIVKMWSRKRKKYQMLISWSKTWPSITSYIVFIFCRVTAYRMCGALACLVHLLDHFFTIYCLKNYVTFRNSLCVLTTHLKYLQFHFLGKIRHVVFFEGNLLLLTMREKKPFPYSS